MNFLAHLYLSGSDPKVMVGNFLGDFVKGSALLKTFDEGIVKGIHLHRGIDVFTDTHQIVRLSKDRLRPKYRHYSGVIVDMFYDHLLAANWSHYHPSPLATFAAEAYSVLLDHQSIFPDKAKQVLPYIVKGNWLVGYASTQGIHQALSGMARRSKHDSKMDEAIQELDLYYSDFKKEFEAFFPELEKYSAQFEDLKI